MRRAGGILLFDSQSEFCQAMPMFSPIKKFVAVLLAIWLPLFSGSALAASVAMQTTSGDCHPLVVPANQLHTHNVSTIHQHYTHHDDQTASSQVQASGQKDQQNSSCKDCGVCHFACSGYLATVTIIVTGNQVLAQKYTSSSTRFQSFSSAPLDPPPLFLV
ncbi:MAG: hypothetical protein WA635_06720, partial [Gallionella sp.]